MILIEIAIEILMQKRLANFFYWLLIKTAQSYYGEAIKTEEVTFNYH